MMQHSRSRFGFAPFTPLRADCGVNNALEDHRMTSTMQEDEKLDLPHSSCHLDSGYAG